MPEGFFSLVSGKYTWLYMLVFFFSLFIDLSTSWSIVQRFYSTRSEKDARKAGWLVSALLFLGPPLFFFPAMAARVFLPGIPVGQENGVYAMLCKAVLPVGLMGLVVAAMFAATMSTLGGFYNAMASVITNDFYLRMVNPAATAPRRVLVARLSTAIVGMAVIGCTFLMRYAQGADDLFNVTNKMSGVFSPPIALPILAGLLIKRVSRRAGLIGLVSGIVTGILAFVAGTWVPGIREMIPMTALTTAATVLGLALGTVFRPDAAEERRSVNAFFDRLGA